MFTFVPLLKATGLLKETFVGVVEIVTALIAIPLYLL